MRREIRGFLLRGAISLALLLLLLRWIEPARLLGLVRKLDLPGVILVLALVTTDRFLMAYKWRLLLLAKGINISFLRTVGIYYMATFAGLFLPASIGGDAVRALNLRGELAARHAVASIVVERSIGLLTLSALALVSFLLFREVTNPFLIRLESFVLVLSLLMGMVIALSFGLLHRFGTGGHGDGRPWTERIRSWSLAYAEYRNHKPVLLLFALLSFFEGLIPVAVNFTASKSLELHIGAPVFFVAVPLISLLARLPISIGGFGVQEVSFISLLGLLGTPPTEAFSITLVAQCLLILGLAPGAFAYLLAARARPQGTLPQTP